MDVELSVIKQEEIDTKLESEQNDMNDRKGNVTKTYTRSQ